MARADDLDNPLYFVQAQYTHDSNLTRTSQAQADSYLSVTAGGQGTMYLGRQQLAGNLSVYRNKYSTHSGYDYNGYDGKLDWLYQIGNAVSGDIGCEQSQTRISFVDTNGTNSLVKNRNCKAGVKVSPTGIWSWGATLGSNTFRYSAAALNYLDRDESSLDTYAGYTSKGENNVVGYLTHTRYKFTNLFLPTTHEPDVYTQNDLGIRGNYRLTADTNTSFRIGRLSRSDPNLPQRAFNGINGRIGGTWQATGKTALNAALYRNVGAAIELNTNDVVVNGGSVGAVMKPTGKLTLTATAIAEARKYQVNQGSNSHTDNYRSVLAQADYDFSRKGRVSFSVRREDRSSNLSISDYKANVVQVTVNFSI